MCCEIRDVALVIDHPKLDIMGNQCINLWDMEEEKHVKTVMVATGGRVGPVLLKSHQLLVEMGGAWNYGAIQPPRRLVVINLNTGDIVKAVACWGSGAGWAIWNT